MIRQWLSGIRKFFQNSLVAKINLLFIVLILLFIVFSVYNTYSLSTSNKSYRDTIKNYYLIMELKEYAAACNRSLNEYLRSNNRTYLSDFNNVSGKFRTTLGKLKSNLNDVETRYILLSISDSFETYHTTCCNACLKFYQNDFVYYNYMYEAQSINSYLNKYCDELLVYALAEGEKTYAGMQIKQNTQVMFNFFVILFLLILFAFSAVYIHVNITNPLNQLLLAARKISSGSFDIHLEQKNSKDTIAVLTNAFNVMARNIKNMMASIREKAETEKKLLIEKQKNVEYQQMLDRANFLALQTQTNPHFMFNTLNCISRTITLGMHEEAIMMIDSMVTIIRYNLTNANVPVILKQELNITEKYLKIQQYRFRDRIRGEIDCPAELAENIVIPRFTLQPIVENAIIHGLEPVEKGGALRIKVRSINNVCVIKVIDNGIGISTERQRQILKEAEKGHTSLIGIANTKKRLEIFTGISDSFRFISKQGIGTIAEIRIPIIKTKHHCTGTNNDNR